MKIICPHCSSTKIKEQKTFPNYARCSVCGYHASITHFEQEEKPTCKNCNKREATRSYNIHGVCDSCEDDLRANEVITITREEWNTLLDIIGEMLPPSISERIGELLK